MTAVLPNPDWSDFWRQDPDGLELPSAPTCGYFSRCTPDVEDCGNGFARITAGGVTVSLSESEVASLVLRLERFLDVRAGRKAHMQTEQSHGR